MIFWRLSSRLNKSFFTFPKYLQNNTRRAFKVRDFRRLLACPKIRDVIWLFSCLNQSLFAFFKIRDVIWLFSCLCAASDGFWRVRISFFLCLSMSHFIRLEYLHNDARQALKVRDIIWLFSFLNQSLCVASGVSE